MGVVFHPAPAHRLDLVLVDHLRSLLQAFGAQHSSDLLAVVDVPGVGYHELVCREGKACIASVDGILVI